MVRVVDYTVISCWNNDLIRFREDVIKLCNEGWELQGGVAITSSSDGSYRLAQAFVKKITQT